MDKTSDLQIIHTAYAFFDQEIQDTFFYKPLSYSEFESLFFNHYCMIKSTSDTVEGMLIGSIKESSFYIAYLLGNHRIQHELLMDLEAHLKDTSIKTIWWSFYNPIKVPFYTNAPKIHFNAQGVLINSPLETLLISQGYMSHAIMDTYEIDLTKFEKTDYIHNKTNQLRDIGIQYWITNETSPAIEVFKKTLPNPGFIDVINLGIKAKKPILYIVYNGTIMGFTGPVDVDIDGRGTFGGIEVLDTLQGYGAGKLLFFKLLQTFKDIGATYTTLFTGRDNPARHIYIAAGAKITQSFRMMKKEL